MPFYCAALFERGRDEGLYPKGFAAFRDHLYFQAYQDATGFELWRTDGSTVSIVTNLNLGSGSSFPEFLTVFEDALYFRADEGVLGSELWKFDGTNASLVTNLNAFGDAYPQNLTVFKDRLCFSATDGATGWELWSFDGDTVSLVTNLNASGDSFPGSFTLFDESLFFVATTPATGYEIWKFDGQAVTQVSDINPGAGNAYPQFLYSFGNQLLFSATEDGSSNWELWSHTVTPLRILESGIEDGNLKLTWQRLGGTTNVIQAADAVNDAFENVGQPIVLAGNGITVTNLTVPIELTNTAKFFRVVTP
jgi:ELWxxDGT repeat protein